MCVCALHPQLCLLTRAHMRVPRVHTCVLLSHMRCSWTHICVPVVYICVSHIYTHVCFNCTCCVPRVHTCVSELDTRFIVFQVNTCVFHLSTSECRVTTYVCSRCTHVCVLYKKHTLVFQLNTCIRVPRVNVHVCVRGCTSARAACTVSIVDICVFHMYTHMCLNWTSVSELPT